MAQAAGKEYRFDGITVGFPYDAYDVQVSFAFSTHVLHCLPPQRVTGDVSAEELYGSSC